MNQLTQLQSFLQNQFYLLNKEGLIRNLPSKYTDKNGIERENTIPSISMPVNDKVADFVAKELESLKNTNSYITVKDTANREFNVVSVNPRHTAEFADRKTGEIIQREYPATLILSKTNVKVDDIIADAIPAFLKEEMVTKSQEVMNHEEL